MSKDLTKKGFPRKSKAGRPNHFEEDTTELRKQVPNSHFDRLERIVDFELEKLKIKKYE